MKSAFLRYFRMTALLLFVSVLSIGVAFSGLIRNYIADQRAAQLHKHAESLRTYASQTINNSPFMAQDSSFRRTINLVANVSDTQILLVDLNGNITFESENSVEKTAGVTSVSLDLVDNVLDGLMFDKTRNFEGTLGGYYSKPQSTEVVPVVYNDQYIALFFVSMPANNYAPLATELLRIFLLVSLLVLLIAAVFAYVLSRRMMRPLRYMHTVVSSFTLGDFGARIPITGKRDDEFVELARAFNSMADALAQGETLRRGFIANISHEMRTPMTNVLGYINGVLDGTIPPESTQHYLGIISDEIQRLSRLIQRMMDLARLQSSQYAVHPRPLPLNELATRVLLSFETKINQHSLEVEADFPDDSWCMADADAITQVLFNLIENAIKFADEGSTLLLALSHGGGKVFFSVSNHGTPIPPDELPFIFDRFHKADRSRALDPTGLGLGLYLVKTIVNAHGEQVSATSQGGLTTFVFSLPSCKKPN